MLANKMDAQEVFGQVLAIAAPEERQAWLERTCADQPELRRKVEVLLKAYDDAGSFLESPPAALAATAAYEPLQEGPGTVIGPYKLLEQIGEGGFGVVYVAEQTKPVRRKVALKIIKPGMDTKDVIARFEAERQALALMDHPNVAKVLDAGATDSGRPYFVMELVKGVSITEFCDKQKLSTRERLELFVDICRAVQHAHQKGIIHRDLKPSNVMVTVSDGRPIPKVIDFGISKALSQKLTDKTVYTAYGQMVGTPLYMSPEQAEMSMDDIDTRSDVYSLGVLLYELLTGTTPFDKETMKKAGFDEMRRIICEVDPPKPSHRLSTLHAEALSTVSTKRGSDRRSLNRQVGGELDWIVMKALEKDRNRRYESATALAADIRRYLADEPVHACPPSVWYRLRKFSRRNRTRLMTTLIVLVSIFSTVGFFAIDRAAREQERESRRLDLVQQINDSITEAQRFREQARVTKDSDLTAWTKAREFARRAETLAEGGLVEPALRDRVHLLLAQLSEEERDRSVVAAIEAARMSSVDVDIAKSRFREELALPKYERFFREYGIDPQKMTAQQAAARIRSRPPGIRLVLVAGLDEWSNSVLMYGSKSEGNRKTMQWLYAVVQAADDNRWRKQMRDAVRRKEYKKLVELADSIDVTAHPPYTLERLGKYIFYAAQEHQAGVDLLRKAQRQYPGDYWINSGLAYCLEKIEPPQPGEALRFASAALAVRPDNAGLMLNLGNTLSAVDRHEDAIRAYRKAIELQPDYAAAYFNLGNELQRKRDLEGAVAAYRTALKLRPRNSDVHFNLGKVLSDKNDFDGAISAYRMAIKLNPEHVSAHVNLIHELNKKRDWKGAVAASRAAIKLNLRDADIHVNLGNVLSNTGDLKGAIAEFRTAIKLNPREAVAHFNLGNTLRLIKDLEGAIDAYRTAINLNPRYTEAHNNLGNMLGMKGEFDGAIAEFRAAIKLKPDLFFAHNGLGNALEEKGEWEAAIAAYSKAIKLKPDHAHIYNTFAWLLATCRDARYRNPERAVVLATTATKLATKNASYWNTLGVAHYRAENYQAAVTALRKSIDLGNNGDASDYLFLAMAKWRLGDKSRARQWYEKAIEWMKKNRPNGEELRRARAEAMSLMGVPVVAPKPKRDQAGK